MRLFVTEHDDVLACPCSPVVWSLGRHVQ